MPATQSTLKFKSKSSSSSKRDESPSSPSSSRAKKSKSSATIAVSGSKGQDDLQIPTDAELFSSKASIDQEHKPILWKEGDPVPYAALCQCFTIIEGMTGRLVIQSTLTSLIRRVILLSASSAVGSVAHFNGGEVKVFDPLSKTLTAEERTSLDAYVEGLLDVIYLSSNSVAPAYKCVELGVGDAILIKAIGEAYGTNPSMVKQLYEKEGDLGNVAAGAKGKQRTLGFGVKPKPLLAKEVLSTFRQIATTSGVQAQRWKVDKIKGLLVRAIGQEAKYIVRALQGRLRIGLAQLTVLISLAHAVLITRPKGVPDVCDDTSNVDDSYPENALRLLDENLSLEEKLECAVNVIKSAYSELPSFDALIEAVMTVPLYELHRVCTLKPGIPVEPMLAKPTKSVQEVLKRVNGKRFTCEYKYDGERAQVHMTSDGLTKVFSRNLLDTSEKFPEVPFYVREACDSTKVSSFILDTEVVAYNRDTKQFVPFQVLSTRKKAEESMENVKVQIIVQAFDLMYVNGESLLNQTLFDRRDKLKSLFRPIEGKFQFALAMDYEENGDTMAIEVFLDEAIKGKCEGLMVKTLDENANYEPSRRSLNWLKLKKDYLEGLGDSVDLVPIGAYYGRGKRKGVYGAYLLACFDGDSEELQSVCKIGTGFSEEDLKVLSDGLNKHIISMKSSQYKVSDQLNCDVWFDAVQVWEIKAADLSKSSVHKGAFGKLGEAGRGIGLRFPRFQRLREDKAPEQATTSDQILDMYYAQDAVIQDDENDDGI